MNIFNAKRYNSQFFVFFNSEEIHAPNAGGCFPCSSTQITVLVSPAGKGQVLVEVLPGVAHAFPGAGVSLSGNFGPWNL